MAKTKACRNCHFVVQNNVSQCPACKMHDLSEDYSGLIIILDPENSEIAQKLNVSRAGQYALKVR